MRGNVTEAAAEAFLELVAARRGHFRLESGHHGQLWLDLDALFAEPRRLAPFVNALADRIRSHNVSAVCGPLLGGAFLAQTIAHALDVEFWFTESTTAASGDGLYGMRYLLPQAIARRVGGKRAAVVDDVMSAGSALRATFAELRAHGAEPVVAGAMLVLGSAGDDYFARQHVPVEAIARASYDLWEPARCPLCIAGVPLADPATAGDVDSPV